jgi:ribosome biogenesis protein ENP2
VLTKDHYNGFPIKDLKYHTGVDEKRRVISADTRVVKIWDPSADGKARSVSHWSPYDRVGVVNAVP